jgi:2-amino-4-hydroxy-6-hydroxymethyldihydropteridine diphosphokinase
MYETEPVGCTDPSWFLNLAVEAETALLPLELLRRCLEIEAAHGRIRSFHGAPRTLDIDILLIDNWILNDSELTIPHPRMAERRFVLEPLFELAPELIHPVVQKPISSLLRACRDTASVRRYNPGATE